MFDFVIEKLYKILFRIQKTSYLNNTWDAVDGDGQMKNSTAFCSHININRVCLFVLLGFNAVFYTISVNHGDSSRVGNVPCPRAVHHALQ